MKKSNILLLFTLLLGLFACPMMSLGAANTINPLRTTAQDIIDDIRKFQSVLSDKAKFNVTSCESVIDSTTTHLLNLQAQNFDPSDLNSKLNEIVTSLFALRLKLHQKLSDFYGNGQTDRTKLQPCVNAIREGNRVARYIEDYLMLAGHKTALRGNDPAPPPSVNSVLRGSLPDLLTRDQSQVVRIRSGDLLLSRGNAYTSAAIARVSQEESQFSHLTVVYIDAPPGTEMTVNQAMEDARVYTIEAHIEVGAFRRPFKDYINDANARVLQYRSKASAETTHRAAKYIFDEVKRRQEASRDANGRHNLSVNDNPPYDFKMEAHDHSELFCSEVAAVAYEGVGIQIPVFDSNLQKNDLTRRMGITASKTFAPADIELDPQFDLIAEWRDNNKLSSLHRKDVVLNRMFAWMNERKYVLKVDLGDHLFARSVWLMRQLELGFHEDLPRNMPDDVISMTFVLDRIGKKLEQRLIKFEESYLAKHGLRPLFPEQQAELEKFRAEDEVVWRAYMSNPQYPRPQFMEQFSPRNP